MWRIKVNSSCILVGEGISSPFLQHIYRLLPSAVSFQVLPNRSQFFQYESVAFSLNCDQQEDDAAWRIKRNTSKQINSPCPSYSTGTAGSSCFLSELYEMDSGVYWCESEAGKISNTINITVTGKILTKHCLFSYC